VTVVRNGPRLSADFPTVEPDPETRALGDVVVGHLGIMNPQDHLENFLEMARIVRHEHGRADVGFVMVGSGDSFLDLQRLRDELDPGEAVRMTGTIPWPRVLATLSAADICVQPDPPTAFNRNLTMNKLMEYMALGKAVVAFDLPETRVSGGDFVEYVAGDATRGLADAVLRLADDPERRHEMGRMARLRIEKELAWEHQERYLLSVYRRVLPGESLRG
jgi:glycosyltransferase involved in cell wall biosynthesis